MGNYKEGGWVNKYHIQKIEEVPREGPYGGCKRKIVDCDPGAVYFVLRLDEDPHARKATLAYADSVEADNPIFARDIRRKVAEISSDPPSAQPAESTQPEKHLRVTMPDGSKYDVPARIIADDRAKYYAGNDPETTYQEEFDFTMGDDFELQDWAANNMNWEDVAEHAIKVDEPLPPVDFQEGWINGKKEIVWRQVSGDGQ